MIHLTQEREQKKIQTQQNFQIQKETQEENTKSQLNIVFSI